MYIACVEVGVYELDGQRALHFDQIIPIPQSEDCQVKARAKELDTVKKQAKAKRSRTVSLLVASGKLTVGGKVVVIKGAFKALHDIDPQDRDAAFTGEGRFKWTANGLTYDSLNALTRALYQKHGQLMGTIQASRVEPIDSGRKYQPACCGCGINGLYSSFFVSHIQHH